MMRLETLAVGKGGLTNGYGWMDAIEWWPQRGFNTLAYPARGPRLNAGPNRTEDVHMAAMDGFFWCVIAVGGAAMLVALVSGVNQTGLALAQVLVDNRRREVRRQQEEHASAEAAGHAAALEPLLLNPDGTIVEPIVGIVESR